MSQVPTQQVQSIEQRMDQPADEQHASPAQEQAPSATTRQEVHVVAAGPSVITDLGRFRGPSQGLSVNGALDQYAATVANVLVGNPANAPLLEVTAFGVTLSSSAPLLVAVTGAGAEVLIDGAAVAGHTQLLVPAGQALVVRPAKNGLRNYVAVRGAIEAPRLMGSCAPDIMLGFGRTLTTGATVHVHTDAVAHALQQAPWQAVSAPVRLPRRTEAGEVVLQIVEGPDVHEFDGGLSALESGTYKLSPRSNHVGARLAGPVPRRTATGEVLSRGVPIGAVEVPAGDELLVLMRGRGITAGYPVLAVLTGSAQDAAAQIRPGQSVRFERTDVETARAELLQVAADVDALRAQVTRALRHVDAPLT
ncbi:biotin-dependent carboxyltransferase family protein [Kineococcus sp. G2]|uniref:5-oxoprolinase subunit C family protein n=1 Tax=Kineococcus sp. G2 TaxID=3127484 RepID=UPI00301D19B1